MIKVLLVDSQQIFREGMKQLLEAENKYKVITSTDNFDIEQISEQIPEIDLFLLEIETLKEYRQFIKENIIEQYPEKKVVVLSSKRDQNHVPESILLGVHGYLLKEMSYESFIEAINSIFDEGIFLHPYVTRDLVSHYRSLNEQNGQSTFCYEISQPVDLCTKREYEILQLLAEGKSNVEIAETLNISEKTVKNHISNIFRKIDVKDRTQAVVTAIRNKWVRI